MELNQVVKNVVLTKVCSIKPDKDSTESKSISLKIKFDGCTLSDVFTKAVSQSVIQWQNGQGRKNFDSFANHQVVEIDFKSPAKAPTIDPETAMVNKLKGMTPEEQSAYIEEMIKKAN